MKKYNNDILFRNGKKAEDLSSLTNQVSNVNSQLAEITQQSVNPSEIRVMTLGKNLFNYATVTSGSMVNYSDGTIMDSATYSVTDYITVNPNTQYTLNFKHQLAFYDANKVYISGLNSSYFTTPYTITTPANCAFIRTNIKPVDVGSFQVELGSVATSYEVYGYHMDQEESNTSLINLLANTNSSIAINSLYPPSPFVPLLSGVDNQDTIQALVNYISGNGGGMLFIPKGTYYTNEISMPPNVVISGAGENVTILKLNNNRNADLFKFDQAAYSGLVNMTIDANKKNNTLGSGIFITNTNQPNKDTPRQLNIQHVVIRNCAEHGLELDGDPYAVWISQFRFIKIENCNGWGIYNFGGTDNSFYAIDIFNCLKGAVYNSGGANRFIGGKWFCNGDSLNISVNAGCTLYDKGRKNQYVGIEMQDNFGDGIVTDGAWYLDFTNVVVDAVGITGTIDWDKTCIIIKNNSRNIKFNGVIYNYFYEAKRQWRGVYIDGTSKDIHIDGQIDNEWTDIPLEIDNAARNIYIKGNLKQKTYATTTYTASQSFPASTETTCIPQSTTNSVRVAYDNATGTFTIPNDGYFDILFVTGFSFTGTTAQVVGSIFKNGSKTKEFFKRTINNFDRIDSVYTLALNKGDQIQIKLNPTATLTGSTTYSEITILEKI